MEVPSNAVVLSKYFEGFSPTVYVCSGGFFTIGYGHLCSKDHPSISIEQGLIYLEQDLLTALHATVRLCPILLNNENHLGAITDFTFNLGAGRLKASTLRRKINQGAYDEVPYQLMKWVYGGGRKLKGLVLRRKAEAAYFQ
jgi:lysozyme